MLTRYYSLFSEGFERYLEERTNVMKRKKKRNNYQRTTSPTYDSGNKEIHQLLYFCQYFLEHVQRCHRRRYISHELSIYDLLEKSDRRPYSKISRDEHHPLYSILSTVNDSSHMLRRKTPQLPSTERFKNSFVNRLCFKYNLAI